MLLPSEINAYLNRIGYTGGLNSTAETLRALHRTHLLSVPFDNLDIHLGRPIVLEENRIYEKIVKRKRGGFCYELNGLFAVLLRSLGFEVTLLSARVPNDRNELGPEFDHLTLRVDMNEPWLADVGFGDSFIQPLPLKENIVERQSSSVYMLNRQSDRDWRLMRCREGEWRLEYAFSMVPRKLSDFSDMCEYHQHSPFSHFTQKRVCSMATPSGRVTLSDTRLIVTEDGRKRERYLANDEEYTSALRSEFGVVL